eukprot:TRINITY_DN9610_c0_g1_i1.p1 TRINITY_DN9610_c0_g1~~TRINITY_DN9610_c0_g1_i1.p1  ORF type:complete len:168 (-),score=10.39 TRINITY_DN9610_c0_g1_i1:312-740(-)
MSHIYAIHLAVPKEIWISIFTKVAKKVIIDAIFTCRLVCRHWNLVLEDESFWKTLSLLWAPPNSCASSISFQKKKENMTWKSNFEKDLFSRRIVPIDAESIFNPNYRCRVLFATFQRGMLSLEIHAHGNMSLGPLQITNTLY